MINNEMETFIIKEIYRTEKSWLLSEIKDRCA